MTKLYIICGHGAGDPGACAGGKTEAAMVRKFAKYCKKAAGISDDVVILDTSKDWYASNLVNAALKKKVGKNPVAELHMDSASSTAKGGHVCVQASLPADGYDKALSSWEKNNFPGRSTLISKRSDLANLNRAKAHGIDYRLVELCFISNKADRTKLSNNMASLAKSFIACFGIDDTKSCKAIKDTYAYSRRFWNKKYRTRSIKKGATLKIVKTFRGIKYLWGQLADGTWVNLTKTTDWKLAA